MDVQMRAARPEGASFLAWVILTAVGACPERNMGGNPRGSEDECLAFLQKLTVTETPHHLRYSCFLMAEVEGRPVAALGGYDPRILGYPGLRKAVVEVSKKIGFLSQTRQPWNALRGSFAASQMKLRGLGD